LRQEGSKSGGLLSSVVARLGFSDVARSCHGGVETITHQRFGVRIRQRKSVAWSEFGPFEKSVAVADEAQLDDHASSPAPVEPETVSETDLGRLLHAVTWAMPVEDFESADATPAPPEPSAPAEQPAAEPSAPAALEPPSALPAYAMLTGKTIGVVGFSGERAVALGQAIAAQYCSFLTLSHTDAEFKKGAIAPCDVLVIEAREEWTQPGSLEVTGLLRSKKPVVFTGTRESLSHLAFLSRGGTRDFLPEPFLTGDLLWRAAMLIGSTPAVKARGGKTKKDRAYRVIVADDDPATRSLLQAVLAQDGMDCIAAESGIYGLALVKAKDADALVIDVSTPGRDGFQVLADIKRDPALAHVKVILLTARQAEVDVLRGFGLGADDFITKPFSPLEVVARVKRSLARV